MSTSNLIAVVSIAVSAFLGHLAYQQNQQIREAEIIGGAIDEKIRNLKDQYESEINNAEELQQNLQEQISELREENEIAASKLEAAMQEKLTFVAENAGLEAEVRTIKEVLNSTRRGEDYVFENIRLSKKIAELESQTESLRQRIGDLSQTISLKNATIAELNDNLNKQGAELSGLRSRVAAWQVDYQALQMSKKNTESCYEMKMSQVLKGFDLLLSSGKMSRQKRESAREEALRLISVAKNDCQEISADLKKSLNDFAVRVNNDHTGL